MYLRQESITRQPLNLGEAFHNLCICLVAFGLPIFFLLSFAILAINHFYFPECGASYGSECYLIGGLING